MSDSTPATAAQRKGGYESGDGPLPDPESLPTGPAPGAQKAATAVVTADWLTPEQAVMTTLPYGTKVKFRYRAGGGGVGRLNSRSMLWPAR